jgi:alpha-ketoglutarate-dependent taurine dioxygenase
MNTALGSMPMLHTIVADKPTRSIAHYARERAGEIEALVLRHGAVLFRGFPVRDATDFQAFVDALQSEPMDYTYKSTPRTRIGRDVFTATEYPQQLEIPLHCENAYQRSWPRWISLCCLTPSSSGGQTPIASMRAVTAAIAPEILRKFADRKVRYIRHYRPYMDLHWEDVFQTKERSEVARYCATNDIEHQWIEEDLLQTQQICQGVASHPLTGETFFFNQAHLFHVSSLGGKAAADMIEMFGADKLPRHAKFGDGEEIPDGSLDNVRRAFSAAAVDLEWRSGDVVLLDNMQFAHGRRAYRGARRVLASLLYPHKLSDPDKVV